MRGHYGNEECGENCGYRRRYENAQRLYEGSQVSLSDMAAKQASALEKRQALRDAILQGLKQHWPDQMQNAEARLGTMIQKASDDVLLAYLKAFFESTSRLATKAADQPAPAAENLDDLKAALEEAGFTLDGRPSDWAPSVRAQVAARMQERILVTPDTFGDLAGDKDGIPEELYDLFAGEDEHSLEKDPWGVPAAPVRRSLKDAAGDAQGGPGPDDPFSGDPFADDLFADDLFADDQHYPEPVIEGADENFEHDKEPEEENLPEAGGVQEESQEEEMEAGAMRQGEQLGLPGSVKPELTPAPARPKKRPTRKEAAVKAQAPGQAKETPGENPSLLSALERVGMPEPVFTSDIVAGGVAPEQMEEFENAQRSLGTGAVYRFIAGKPRHSERGSLILPGNALLAELDDSWKESGWGRCSGELRGQGLYEAGVLLAKNRGKVRSIEVKGAVVLVGLSSAKGPIGVVFTHGLGAREEDMAMLEEAIQEILQQRVVMVCVTTPSPAPEHARALADALGRRLIANQAKLSAPVTVASSFTFEADGKGTLLQVTA